MRNPADPRDYEWLDTVYERSRNDPFALESGEEIHKCTPAFEKIWESLPQQQRDELDDYICACENYERALTIIAYHLGREKGKIIVVRPKSE